MTDRPYSVRANRLSGYSSDELLTLRNALTIYKMSALNLELQQITSQTPAIFGVVRMIDAILIDVHAARGEIERRSKATNEKDDGK